MIAEQLTTYLWAALYICGAAICLGLIVFLARWYYLGHLPVSSTPPQKTTASAKDAGTALAWFQVFKD